MNRPARAIAASLVALLGGAWLSACVTDPTVPDVTEDGLVRAPSSSVGAVYRAPGVPFTQYQKILLDPLTISFRSGWEKDHREVTEQDLARIRTDASEMFRDEFMRELRSSGRYKLVDAPGPDVIKVSPSILDLDIPAPRSAKNIGVRTYVRSEGEFTLMANLYDAPSGVLIGRVIHQMRAPQDETRGKFQESDSVTNAFVARVAFKRWSRLLREGLDVAKVDKSQSGSTIR